MGWNQTRPQATGTNRVTTPLGGSAPMKVPKGRMGPPGQNRIGPHPQTGTMIKAQNRVGKKGY